MTTLGPETRLLIAKLATQMIPRSSEMPGASDIALAQAPLDRVLRHRPDLADFLEALPEIGSDEPSEEYLHRLKIKNPPACHALLQAVLGAYYMHPEVKRRLGYQGQQALTLPRGGFGGEELLEQVMNMPPRFRDPTS